MCLVISAHIFHLWSLTRILLEKKNQNRVERLRLTISGIHRRNSLTFPTSVQLLEGNECLN